MGGRAKAALRETEDRIAVAYMTAVFTRTERLRKLDFYLKKARPPRKARTPEEMLAVLRQFHAGGAPLSIREIN